ncbi:helix-turn-helix domain-containing protein [Gordonia amarae]|uniref:Helix-turn-helix domain-containing protein n=1 Tax=Gordonia amarae TaxID=36821 RepID=A0A857M6U4_9ACTN|nr:TOBE domain-containing protein [Gordonia amarae]MCS3877066.1 molybdopterin-binding protein [Gordonia amarae]QHN15876.1 helix-turn-helix domain-containing protein [Gordonia amarae]QHN20444.1 helix-turn-helix domain-containing protein [Gordonia amarae]QHN29296.1 helix-turn-helix domain-containing protein [Gordonia amarae]QHN38074.1 helix-turn-helix domain-containing protein [Gordonia amarae]
MSRIRISEAAALLGVSDDTVRRWITAGELPATGGEGVTTVDGAALAELARRRAQEPADDGAGVLRSARNRFTGLVTDVRTDAVMAQVTLQCGPFEVTSLMSSDAVRELGLEPGSVATAVVKATTVIVEVKGEQR